MQPPKKNERLTLSIQDLSPDGQGVGKTAGGFVVYVPGALPGETVQAHIIKTTARYAVGKLLSRQQDSPDRTPPPCPVFGRCGGCQLQHLAYEAQLRHKQAMVRQCLTRIGGLQQPEVRPTLGMDQPWHYRNKGQFPCAEVDGKAALASLPAAAIAWCRWRTAPSSTPSSTPLCRPPDAGWLSTTSRPMTKPVTPAWYAMSWPGWGRESSWPCLSPARSACPIW